MPARSAVARQVNNVLRPFNVQLVPGFSADPAVKGHVPAGKTLSAARKAGIPGGDYIIFRRR